MHFSLIYGTLYDMLYIQIIQQQWKAAASVYFKQMKSKFIPDKEDTMKKVSRIYERMERDREILEAAIKARTGDGIKQGPVYKMINMSMEDYSTDQKQQADEKTVTVKFEIDRDIYNQCVEAFTALGTTIEEMALGFIKFCVKNPDIISAYIKEDADEELKQKVFEAVYAIAAKKV